MTDRYNHNNPENFPDYDEKMAADGNPVNPPVPLNNYTDKNFSTKKNEKFEEPLNTYTDKPFID